MIRRRRRRGGERPEEAVRQRTRRALTTLRARDWVLPAGLVGDVPPATTRIGVADGATSTAVDGRGLVSPSPRWSLDWAVGADDRWHVPAGEVRVEQVRVDHAPAVQTTLRVPGGDVVHRAWAARAAPHPAGDEWVAVEVENRTAVPVAVAWAVRPFTPTAAGGVDVVEVAPAVADEPQGPWVVRVDGEVAAVLPRRPSRWAAGVDGSDPLATVLAGDASADWDAPVVGRGDGLASVAVLVPVPHTATARLALPIGGSVPAGAPGVRSPDVPGAVAVAAGWTTFAERGPRLEVPDPVLADAVAAARRSLSLAHRVRRERAATDAEQPPATHTVTAGTGWAPRDPVADRMELLGTLAWWGDVAAVDRALVDWADGQQRGGGFGSPRATAAALRALSLHLCATDDPGPAAAWLPEVGGAVESLGRALRRPPRDVDPGAVAEGLDAAATLLAALGQQEAAARVAADADRALALPVPPPAPLDLDAPSTPPRRLAAAAVAAARDGRPVPEVWALLRRASATWTWPDPDRWEGDDGLVSARLLDATARMLVLDRADGPALAPWLPPAWWGLGWEVHGAPTRWGRLSYAVRWHSGRPAVLWELGPPAPGVPEQVRLTAPGLDRSWSSTERRGEALLAPVAPPAEVDPGPSGATGGVAIAAPPRSVWRPQDPGPDAVGPSEAHDHGAGDDGGPRGRRVDPDDDGGSFT